MTRIIAGELGGRRLATLPGAGTRPTSERTREALFSSLEATHDLDEGPFVDLFAGSGAVGLEALSRGAPRAVFVESAKPAAAVIARNIRDLGVGGRAEVILADARHAVGRLAGLDAATLFCDPPYAYAAETLAELIDGLVRADAVHPDALLVVERDRRDAWHWPASVEALRDRRYGESVLWYGRRL